MNAAAETNDLSPQMQAIVSQAAAVDADVAPVITHGPDGQPIAQAEDAQGIQDAAYSRNRDLLAMGIGALTPMLPFLPDCYTPDVIDRIAVAFTAVEIKRGWNLGDQMTPEVMLAVAAIPPSLTAFMLGREYLATKRAEKTAQNAGNQETAFPGAINGNSQ